jgi:D-inositol-3-phosphate glycosyltransferase
MKLNAQIREHSVADRSPAASHNASGSDRVSDIAVTLLTGGMDRPYTYGLTMELISKGATVEVIGSDSLDFPEFHTTAGLKFRNLQGSQRADVSTLRKVSRLLAYYARLIRYSLTAKPRIFHVLWNGKFELFDRTALTIFFRLLGKRVVLTAHNVNAGKRDSTDSVLNRLSLRIQYRLADHIFVHTEKGKLELNEEFGVPQSRVTVIPFGINNAVPNTSITQHEAKQQLGIQDDRKTILFFGRITPYKGLDYLVAAFRQISGRHDDCRLIVAGRPENDCLSYWNAIQEQIRGEVRDGRILLRADHIPDDETELYFKAADVLVLPYRNIYQSGVLFLSYSFGLPILASDLDALKDQIIEGETGFVFRSEDPVDLAATIERYFASDLFANLKGRRQAIQAIAAERHSWEVVGRMTMEVYGNLLQNAHSTVLPKGAASEASLNMRNPS